MLSQLAVFQVLLFRVMVDDDGGFGMVPAGP